jgi:hypothetical protein
MNKPFDMYSWRRKYIYLAENDSQYPDYNPEIHKTLLVGAIDLELQGDNVVMYLPFEEEEPNAVAYKIPASELESKLGVEINDQEDLDAAYDDVYRWVHNKWSGTFGAYNKTQKTESNTGMNEGSEDVDTAYYDTIAFIKTKARKLNDDDAYQYHEQLKSFFNRLLQEEDHTKNPNDKYRVVAPKNEVETEDNNLDFSDYNGHSSSDDMLNLYERYIKKD